jgi:hypothetical protein
VSHTAATVEFGIGSPILIDLVFLVPVLWGGQEGGENCSSVGWQMRSLATVCCISTVSFTLSRGEEYRRQTEP